MYNGIGLATPRGSGTSGYIQRNLSSVKPRRTDFPGPIIGSDDSHKRAPKIRKENADLLEHEKRRQIEIKLIEFSDKLDISGLKPEKIEKIVSDERQRLLAQLDKQQGKQPEKNQEDKQQGKQPEKNQEDKQQGKQPEKNQEEKQGEKNQEEKLKEKEERETEDGEVLIKQIGQKKTLFKNKDHLKEYEGTHRNRKILNSHERRSETDNCDTRSKNSYFDQRHKRKNFKFDKDRSKYNGEKFEDKYDKNNRYHPLKKS